MNLHHHDQELRLRGILAKVTYKPNWEFWVDRQGFSDQLTVWCRWKVPDADNPKEIVAINRTYGVTSWSLVGMTDEEIVRYVLTEVIRGAELHEMEEWFKYEGQHVRDPHPDLKKTA